MLRLRIFDPVLQLYQLGILGRHVNPHIGRNPVLLIGQPFNGAGIDQGADPVRLSLIIDLRIQAADLELRDHIHHASHLPVA